MQERVLAAAGTVVRRVVWLLAVSCVVAEAAFAASAAVCERAFGVMARPARLLGPPLFRLVGLVGFAAYAAYRRAYPRAAAWIVRHRHLLNRVRGFAVRTIHRAERLALRRSAETDPVYARSVSWSFTVHFLVIVLSSLPLVLQGIGCVRPVDAPLGDGVAGPPVVRRVQVRVQRWVVNPMSAIRLDLPKPEKVEVDLDKQTQNPWMGGVAGAAGKPGFRGGVGGGAIPFMRLRHGGDWDNDLDADDNMLKQFNAYTGIPVRGRAESLDIGNLMSFPPKRSPPFVYIYGTRVCDIKEAEVVALRRYLSERGGMLIADAGGPGFDSSFRAVVNRLFPGLRLADIPNDDPIYEKPFHFANGAPALWHHGGRRALGVRYQGRLVVFYHPGDMNDAWKEGHSGARPEVWKAAYELGTNVIYYAVGQYLQFIGRQ